MKNTHNNTTRTEADIRFENARKSCLRITIPLNLAKGVHNLYVSHKPVNSICVSTDCCKNTPLLQQQS